MPGVARRGAAAPWGGHAAPVAGLVALLVLAAASPGAARLSLRRPVVANGVEFQHCAAKRGGETRPASWCPTMRLVAVRGDVRVPASGMLDVPLDASGATDEGPPIAAGPVLLVPEALTYARDATTAAVGKLLASPADARMAVMVLAGGGSLRPTGFASSAVAPATTPGISVLGMADGVLGMRVSPQELVEAGQLPARVRLRFGAADRGRRTVYAVWAWQTPRRAETVVLEPLVPRPGEGLAVSFAVPTPGWTVSSPPVTFRVVGGPPGQPGTVLWSRRVDAAGRPVERGWLDAEVDLGALAGRETTLALEASVDGEGRSFPVWGEPVLLAPASDGPRPLNVLLVSLDTLRADHLGLYGHGRDTSPLLDAFAAKGVVFDRAFSTFSSTTASHMSMFTSLQPCAHGVLLPGGAKGTMRLSPTATTLAQALAAGGWATGAVTEDGLIKGDIGFDRGFDRYQELVVDATAPLGLFPEGIALANAWIDANAGRPFFLFLHTYQPHEPFKAPPHLAGRWAPGSDAPRMAWFDAAYDEGIRYTDELLGGFLGGLERRGVLDDTIVVIVSDHGEELGEHGDFGHGYGLHVEQVHVPLIIRHPTLAQGGRRVPQVVSLVDLAPTILELVGVPRPASFTGRSLAPLLSGGTIPSGLAFAELLGVSRATMVRSATHAWIQSRDRLEAYALLADPAERDDIAARQPGFAQGGARFIEQFRQSCQEKLATLAPPAPAPALDPERLRALQALGYVQ